MFKAGISCGKLVDQIIEKTKDDQSSVNEFATYLSHQFWILIKGKTVQNKDKESMFNKFYNFSIDEGMLSEWVKMLKCLGIVVQSPVVLQMTVQFILDKFLQFSLKPRNELLLPAIKDEINEAIHMEKSEEVSLRYVAGYIIFSLKKSIKSKRSPEGFALHQLLSCWGSREELDKQVKFLEYTKAWVDRVNRGGLLLVSDEFYIFVQGIENEVRKIPTIHILIGYCSEDVKGIKLEKLNANPFIQNLWDTLTKDVYNKQLTEKLKLQIFKKWTNIRINTFVTTYVLIMRRKASRNETSRNKISGKGTSSLRKELGKDCTKKFSLCLILLIKKGFLFLIYCFLKKDNEILQLCEFY